MVKKMSLGRRLHRWRAIRRHRKLRPDQENIPVRLQIGQEELRMVELGEALKLIQKAVDDRPIRLTFEGLRNFSLLTFGDGSVYLNYTENGVRQGILILNTGSKYDRLPPRVEAAPLRSYPATVTVIWNPATEQLTVEWSIAPWLQVHEETILPRTK